MWSRCIVFASCLFVTLLGGSTAQAQPVKPKDGPLSMKFVPLPKGTFYMGWNGFKGSAKKTEIKEEFEIATHTVTQGQWQELMGKNPSWFSREPNGKDKLKDIKDEDLKQFPVETVSWEEAQEFIKKLNEKEKGKGYKYRLPTEKEWEYACRGGATSEEECSYHFYFAKPTNDLSSKQANFNGEFPCGKGEKGPYLGRPTKVGSYAPNKLGLYDMHGNVHQWCEDLYDPEGGGSERVVRGGYFGSEGSSCWAASRTKIFGTQVGNYGFRLARVPVQKQPGKPAPEPAKPKDGPLGMKFVPLPKATFYMGWDGVEKKKGVKTEIKEDFEIAIHTVTQGQWQAVMGKNPSVFSRNGEFKNEVKDIKDEDLKQFPVEGVSWNDVQEFIKKLNEQEKGKGWLYRLPSEAEWEYACRGGATSEEECSYHFYFAKPTNDLSSKQANFNGAFSFGKADKGPYLSRTTKVGSYLPNKLGLYDMHGNVWQLCSDLFDPKGITRVSRGGGWSNVAGDCRAALRRDSPVFPSYDLGFRLVRVSVQKQDK